MQHSAVLGRAKNCLASHFAFSVVNMIILKSYLDLHLSDSDWCRFVVEFGLSDLIEKHSESPFVRTMVNKSVVMVTWHNRVGPTQEQELDTYTMIRFYWLLLGL